MTTLAAKKTPVINAYTTDEIMKTLHSDLAQARNTGDEKAIKRIKAKLYRRIDAIFKTQ